MSTEKSSDEKDYFKAQRDAIGDHHANDTAFRLGAGLLGGGAAAIGLYALVEQYKKYQAQQNRKRRAEESVNPLMVTAGLEQTEKAAEDDGVLDTVSDVVGEVWDRGVLNNPATAWYNAAHGKLPGGALPWIVGAGLPIGGLGLLVGRNLVDDMYSDQGNVNDTELANTKQQYYRALSGEEPESETEKAAHAFIEGLEKSAFDGPDDPTKTWINSDLGLGSLLFPAALATMAGTGLATTAILRDRDPEKKKFDAQAEAIRRYMRVNKPRIYVESVSDPDLEASGYNQLDSVSSDVIPVYVKPDDKEKPDVSSPPLTPNMADYFKEAAATGKTWEQAKPELEKIAEDVILKAEQAARETGVCLGKLAADLSQLTDPQLEQVLSDLGSSQLAKQADDSANSGRLIDDDMLKHLKHVHPVRDKFIAAAEAENADLKDYLKNLSPDQKLDVLSRGASKYGHSGLYNHMAARYGENKAKELMDDTFLEDTTVGNWLSSKAGEGAAFLREKDYTGHIGDIVEEKRQAANQSIIKAMEDSGVHKALNAQMQNPSKNSLVGTARLLLGHKYAPHALMALTGLAGLGGVGGLFGGGKGALLGGGLGLVGIPLLYYAAQQGWLGDTVKGWANSLGGTLSEFGVGPGAAPKSTTTAKAPTPTLGSTTVASNTRETGQQTGVAGQANSQQESKTPTTPVFGDTSVAAGTTKPKSTGYKPHEPTTTSSPYSESLIT